MKSQHLSLISLLLTLGMAHSVHASCDSFSTKLKNINAEEKEAWKQFRRLHVEERCGSESQSWLGGAAGSRRFEYLNCKLSARNSDALKEKWAPYASAWQAKKEKLKLEGIAFGCAE